MTTDDLRAQIDQLHHELEMASKTDHHIKDMFGSLMEDIINIASGKVPAEQDLEGVQDQLEEHATNFESRHPKLASAIQQIMDMLAKMGI